jgi:hypothetical protein
VDWEPPAPWQIAVRHSRLSMWEFPTLMAMQDYCRDNRDAAVLYFHNKGSTAPGDQTRAAWRRYMTWCMVRRWRECVLLLDRFDAVGAALVRSSLGEAPGVFHFGGNFWWVCARHALRLPAVVKLDWCNRFDGEAWIGKLRARVAEVHRPRHLPWSHRWGADGIRGYEKDAPLTGSAPCSLMTGPT